jgi:alpha-beta hydrolase superfamily lysophospholipase
LFLGAAGSSLVGWQLSRPVPASIGPPPPDLNATPVAFRSGSGLPIYGWLSRGASGRGLVLLLPGIRANRLSMVDRARFLRVAGYSTLAIDLQATGESPGDRITFGWRERLDVLAAVRFLKQEMPAEPVAVLGTSLGGAAALFATSELDVQAMILEAVYPTLDVAVENRLRIRMGGIGAVFAPLLKAQIRPTVGVWPSELKPVDRIGQLRCPVLVIGGTRDQHTTAADTHQLYDAARAPKELWMIEGADHADFLRARRAEYESRVLAFLGRVLRSGRGSAQDLTTTAQSDTQAIYSAVIALSFHARPGSRFAVVDRSIAMSAISDRLLQELKAARVPDALIDAVRRGPAADQPLDSSILPAGTGLVSKAKADAFVSESAANRRTQVHRESGADGVLSLSAVAFSPDRLDAVVRYHAHCGGLCGEGGYVWLRRIEASGRWAVVRAFATWVS